MNKDIDKLFERGSVSALLLMCIAVIIEIVKSLLKCFLLKCDIIFFTIDIMFLVFMLVAISVLTIVLIKFMFYLIKHDKLEKK
jgi:hypothetical protein